MVGDDLHETIVYQIEAKLFADNVYDQQQNTAQQRRGNQTFSKQRYGTAQDITQHQKHQQKSQLH